MVSFLFILHTHTHTHTPGYVCLLMSVRATTGNDDDDDGPGDRDYAYSLQHILGIGATQGLRLYEPPLKMYIGSPKILAQSKNGDVYFVSNKDHSVLKIQFGPSSEISNVTRIAGTGYPGKGADDMMATESDLQYPYSVTLIENDQDELTHILITDTRNHRVRKMDMVTGKIFTLAGTGQMDFYGDGGQATAAKFDSPISAYYDNRTGDVYIADQGNHRIRKVAPDGIVTTVAGKTCGPPDESGDGGLATNACILSPIHFTMNPKGEWFILENYSKRIRKVGLDGIISTVVGGGNHTGFDDAPATSIKLPWLSTVQFSPDGEMFVTDSDQTEGNWNSIRKVGTDGIIKVIAGGGGTKRVPSTHPIGARTAIVNPVALAFDVDGSGDMFVSDYWGKIHKLIKGRRCFGIRGNKASVCSGHGQCIAPDLCECDRGWMGADCTITHCFGISSNLPDRVCSGRGKCVRPNKCHCNDGFRGHKCHHRVP